MRVFGLDFTSRPRPSKPLTCAVCEAETEILRVHKFEGIEQFSDLESFLGAGGTWIAGIDFPFGMPRKLIDDLHYPRIWKEYVAKFGAMSRQDFVDFLTDYKQKQPIGSKEHRRVTDIAAGSLSPMKLYGVPVGKMFFEGAPRLVRSDATVLPFLNRSIERIIVEAYPGLVARTAIGRRSYKTDSKRKQCPEHASARHDVVQWLRNACCAMIYGLTIELDADLARAVINDPSGDILDAVLCALQAAWAFSKREDGYGIPGDVDLLEGWIVDPQPRMTTKVKQPPIIKPPSSS
ncbi:MAG: DUF429 domain-containing protein [Syntrophobacteraceae bacterium]